MIGTVAAGILAPVVIEISGLPATIALLAPFVALLIVIVRLHRTPAPRRRPEREEDAPRAGPGAPPPEAATADAGVVPDAGRRPAVDWAARIRTAEAADDHASLAGLYLSFARAEMAEGRNDPAAGHLRSSVRAAARCRNASVQAEARLELAELARAAGDLTTACEHWQIARSLFHELKQSARLGETERLMQTHGCPTDWVLNDF